MIECPNCKKLMHVDIPTTVPTKVNSRTGACSAPTIEGPFPDKRCPHCNIVKTQHEFYKHRITKKYASGETKVYYMLRHQCIECERPEHNERCDKWSKKRKLELQESYNLWRETIDSIPTKRLTDEQWLKAIEHFNGCALCDETHVEVREFFDKNSTSSYYIMNIVPLCNNCFKIYKNIENPFRIVSKFKQFTTVFNKEKTQKLLDYFIEKIMEAINDVDIP